jgi:HD superfamily phosphohydrolase YqeK
MAVIMVDIMATITRITTTTMTMVTETIVMYITDAVLPMREQQGVRHRSAIAAATPMQQALHSIPPVPGLKFSK